MLTHREIVELKAEAALWSVPLSQAELDAYLGPRKATPEEALALQQLRQQERVPRWKVAP